MRDDLEPVWTALDEGRCEEALGALELLGDGGGAAGRAAATLAWLGLGELERAERALAEATRAAADDDDAADDVAWARGELRLAQWRLEDARAAFERLDGAYDDPAVLERLALLADLEGDEEAADGYLARAHRADPDAYPLPARLDPREFDRVVAEAAAELPEPFRAAFEETPVLIDPVPSRELAAADPAGTPPDVLGLFVGASMLERDVYDAPAHPAAIWLFQRNLERVCADREELVEQIRTTLYHELGHLLGFDEHGVDEMGLG